MLNKTTLLVFYVLRGGYFAIFWVFSLSFYALRGYFVSKNECVFACPLACPLGIFRVFSLKTSLQKQHKKSSFLRLLLPPI